MEESDAFLYERGKSMIERAEGISLATAHGIRSGLMSGLMIHLREFRISIRSLSRRSSRPLHSAVPPLYIILTSLRNIPKAGPLITVGINLLTGITSFRVATYHSINFAQLSGIRIL